MTWGQARKLADAANQYADEDKVAVLAEIADAGELASAALTLSRMHYEYTVAIGVGDKTAYAYGGTGLRFTFGPLALADWWQTKGEAQDLVDELQGMNQHTTARVVRRLVSDLEVVE